MRLIEVSQQLKEGILASQGPSQCQEREDSVPLSPGQGGAGRVPTLHVTGEPTFGVPVSSQEKPPLPQHLPCIRPSAASATGWAPGQGCAVLYGQLNFIQDTYGVVWGGVG